MVFDPRWIADCRAWLIERLGPLVYFDDVVEVVEEAVLPAEPVAAEPPEDQVAEVEPEVDLVAAEPAP